MTKDKNHKEHSDERPHPLFFDWVRTKILIIIYYQIKIIFNSKFYI